MRIMYYTSKTSRELNRVNVTAITNAYVLHEHQLVCDTTCFQLPDDEDADMLLIELFMDGKLDLRDAEIIKT